VAEQLKAQAKGTSIPSISTNTLSHWPVEIPPLPIQNLIVKIAEAAMHEAQILQKITSLKTQLINQTLIKAIAE
jgi:restriction endonuclease S subunit